MSNIRASPKPSVRTEKESTQCLKGATRLSKPTFSLVLSACHSAQNWNVICPAESFALRSGTSEMLMSPEIISLRTLCCAIVSASKEEDEDTVTQD